MFRTSTALSEDGTGDSLNDGISVRSLRSIRSIRLQNEEDIFRSMNHNDAASADGLSSVGATEFRKSKFLKGLKWIFLLCLTIIGSGVAITAYLFTSSQEDIRFQEHFTDDGEQLRQAYYERRSGEIWALFLLSTQLSAEENTKEEDVSSQLSKWPNVTLTEFQDRALGALQIANSESIFFCPLLYAHQLDSWLEYASHNQFAAGISGPLDSSERTVNDGLFELTEDGIQPFNVSLSSTRPIAPIWQLSPWELSEKRKSVMLDFYSIAGVQKNLLLGLVVSLPQFSAALDPSIDYFFRADNEQYTPRGFTMLPVWKETKGLVSSGVVAVEVIFEKLFHNVLVNSAPLTVVLSNTCGQNFTYRVEGGASTYEGVGDRHDPQYSELGIHTSPAGFWGYFQEDLKVAPFFIKESNVNEVLNTTYFRNAGACFYDITIYPTGKYESTYKTMIPLFYTFVAIFIFVFAAIFFFIYDTLLERRQALVLDNAARSNAILKSLFPDTVRHRLFKRRKNNQKDDHVLFGAITPKNRLTRFLASASTEEERALERARCVEMSVNPEEPIADLFPNTTIMFADIAGFTAWSSEREAPQVFMLLETIYHSFDIIAKRLNVFKVETIGDCYVAVTGLPEPHKDHALIMARFAHEICLQMTHLTRQLEVTLGPGTSDLCLRVGIHSGPVTAGVLRGEKYRFQLFGDTMNTASRMESTGKPRRIQISQASADLLLQVGKGNWLIPRESAVVAKGKGEMTTFWLKIRTLSNPNRPVIHSRVRQTSSSPSGSQHQGSGYSSSEYTETVHEMAPLVPRASKLWGQMSVDESSSSNTGVSQSVKEDRLIDWNTEVLLRLLEKVVQNRLDGHNKQRRPKVTITPTDPMSTELFEGKTTVIDEVAEVIELPNFNLKTSKKKKEMELPIQLPPEVRIQLREYVANIASMYRHVPFHNFEHASHVTMSANKLMKRIIKPDSLNNKVKEGESKKNQRKIVAEDLHNSTFGISSDPLTQFAVVFSALIHDVDHYGVPNTQLVKEKTEWSAIFGNQSVAEQNSVVVAWDLLMEPKFADLQVYIFANDEGQHRFRQLLVNTVMATDIMDSDLVTMRKNKWERAFATAEDTQAQSDSVIGEDINRKATIVIEHIIQASDVAHTMQHWHIYTKWNEKLYQEMREAYKNERSEKDPAEKWYENELAFFDFYIIPLARKLQECGVFGVSSDEYLGFALENRNEWEMKGRQVTEAMVAKYQ